MFWSARRRVGFTLIELLVVIAIIAVLAVVVILVLNPAALLQQSRDANRLSDLSTINSAMNLFAEDVTGGSLGSSATAYISTSDPSATSTAGDQCQGLNLASFSPTGNWQCAATSSVKSISGTGWIPANLTLISAGSPLGSLPLDPTNQTSSGLYYSFGTNGTTFEVTAVMESQKYRTQFSTNPVLSLYPGVAGAGSNPAVAALFSSAGLVGYWSFEEGTGTVVNDVSGNGSLGTWAGTLGNQYGTGKVGYDAGVFDGTDNLITLSNPSTALQGAASAGTMTAWILYSNATTSMRTIFDFGGSLVNSGLELYQESGGTNKPYFSYGTSGGTVNLGQSPPSGLAAGTWHFVAATWSSAGGSFYVDGALYGNPATSTTAATVIPLNPMYIGWGASSHGMLGDIDDMRVYSRVLSLAEIQALYNAQH